MLKTLRRNSKTQEIPEAVQAALVSQFRLDREALPPLRLFEQRGQFASRPVKHIRLVDPALLGTDAKTQFKYSTFDNGQYKKAVQFEGHIEKEGYVLLHDRRPRKP